MKLTNILYLLPAGILLLAQYSCEKQLNALPSQAVVDGNVVVDQKSAEIALNGAYYRFAGTSTVLSTQSTLWSNQELVPAMLAGWMQGAVATSMYQIHSYTPASTGSWGWPYGVLNAANGTIAGVEALADSKFNGTRKTEILAEARFLRAYAHFYLLSYFGEWYKPESPYGVMLRKGPLTLSSNGNTPRSSVKDSYDYILEDIDYAIENGPVNRPVYYANKAAARMLKLRVLISRGLPGDYTELIRVADQVIANSQYTLEPSLQDLFQVKGLTSKEVILGVTPYPNQLGKKSMFEWVQSNAYLATNAFKQLLGSDPRSTWMIRNIPTPVPSASLKPDSIYMNKYTGPKYEDIYVFRLTEAHLLKAEAIVRSGGSLTDAKNILKDIMEHAGVTDFSAVDNASTPDEVIYQIYLEFSRNMVAESSIDWFALLRLPFEKVKQIRPTITKQELYIFPIPATEFQLNPSIGDQNPGYPKQ